MWKTEHEHLPAGQTTHVAAFVAPTTLEALPAGQRLQRPAPKLEYRPGWHGVQSAEPAELNFPAGQRLHVVDEVAPTTLEARPEKLGIGLC